MPGSKERGRGRGALLAKLEQVRAGKSDRQGRRQARRLLCLFPHCYVTFLCELTTITTSTATTTTTTTTTTIAITAITTTVEIHVFPLLYFNFPMLYALSSTCEFIKVKAGTQQ